MVVFYILLLIPVMIQYIAVREDKVDFTKKNEKALLFFFVFLTFLVALRHESVGNDTRNYINIFNRIATMDWYKAYDRTMEFGFSFFSKTISLFTKEYRVYFILTAIVTVIMIYPTYRRLCADAVFSIVLFCNLSIFVMCFSGVCQMLAIGIGCIAYEFVRRKNLPGFIAIVCLAVTIHTSAFMLAFMYPLYYAKITKKWLIAVIPVVLVVFVFNQQIFSVLAVFLERYTEYDASINQSGAYAMIILFAAFAVFAYIIPDESVLDEEVIGLRNFMLLSLVLQMFAPLHTIAMRMNYYYIIFIPLLLPKIIECRSKRWEQVALLGRHIMVIFFLIYFFVNASKGGNLNVFPYHFFWENVI